MHLGFFSLAVRKCIEDDDVSGVGITLDHSLRIQSLMVEESRLQELETAGRMAPATRRLVLIAPFSTYIAQDPRQGMAPAAAGAAHPIPSNVIKIAPHRQTGGTSFFRWFLILSA